jgi:hypothetical protein
MAFPVLRLDTRLSFESAERDDRREVLGGSGGPGWSNRPRPGDLAFRRIWATSGEEELLLRWVPSDSRQFRTQSKRWR